jgi:uncharacterized protein YggE
MKNYAPDGTVASTYYSVDNTVYVTVRDLSKLGKLLDAVVSSGANTINGINFDITNKDAALAQARDMAITNAKPKQRELPRLPVSTWELCRASASPATISPPRFMTVKRRLCGTLFRTGFAGHW